MQGAACFAYSLSQEEGGWRWTVYDEDGVTVAGGADASRHAAQAAVELTIRRAESSEVDLIADFRRGNGTLKRDRELIARS